MHAVVIRDSQLHWEERDDPSPGDTELLVAVRAAGLNNADLSQRAGGYPPPPGSPPATTTCGDDDSPHGSPQSECDERRTHHPLPEWRFEC